MNSFARVLATVVLLMIVGDPRSVAAQAPVLVLDHVYIVVEPGAAAALQALRQAGLVVDSSVHRHPGEGTASVAAFFDNAYLELLWVDSSVAVDSLHGEDWAAFVRAQDWRRSGASPFGFGLHFLSGSVADLRVPMRLDSAYALLRQPTESLAADLFVMPARAAVPTWIDRFKGRRPDLFAHPLGVRRVTRVTVRGPAPQRPHAATLGPRLIGFEEAATPQLALEFDEGRQHRTIDLRPVLPLVLSY